MKPLRRWNLALGIAVILSGFSLAAKPASARMLECPTESCGDDCLYDCWQSGCSTKSCDPIACFGSDGQLHPKTQHCYAP